MLKPLMLDFYKDYRGGISYCNQWATIILNNWDLVLALNQFKTVLT